MNVDATVSEGILHLCLGAGVLDSACTAAVKANAVKHIDGSADVVVDLSRVEFVDSSGVGALVSLLKATRVVGRRAKFAGAQPGVLSILHVIKLDQIFELAPDAASARRSLLDEKVGALLSG